MPRPRQLSSPYRYVNSLPEVIRLVVMMYVKYPLSLQSGEDLLFERGIDICHETVRFWWNIFGPVFADDIRSKRVSYMRGFRHWRWHLDEMYVKINGEMHYLWRAVDQEGEMLEYQGRGKKSVVQHSKRADYRSLTKEHWNLLGRVRFINDTTLRPSSKRIFYA